MRTSADPHGLAVDLLRSCYESWMRVPEYPNPIRVRWYAVPDNVPDLDPPSLYSSSNWDEVRDYDPPLGEQSSTRNPWADWRDCSPPPWWTNMDCANCPNGGPNALSLAQPSLTDRTGHTYAGRKVTLAYAGNCVWEEPADDGLKFWRFTAAAGRPVASWIVRAADGGESVLGTWAVLLAWDCQSPVTLSKIGGGPGQLFPPPQPDLTFFPLTTEVDLPLIGSIVTDSGTGAVPALYVECNGQAISRATYSRLFRWIGTTYGVGDGATTFQVPDLRGLVQLGRWPGTHETGSVGGEVNHVLTPAEMPLHTHGVTDPGHSHPPLSGTNHAEWNAAGQQVNPVASAVAFGAAARTGTAVTGLTVQSAGGGASHNNMQPYLTLRQLIYAGAAGGI